VRVVRVLETLCPIEPYAGRKDTKQIRNRADQNRSLLEMASTSMSMALPVAQPSHLDSHFNSTPFVPPASGSPHRRKTSRNPKLPPLPTFTFNPGVTSEEGPEQDRAPSPTHPILEEMAARQEPKRSSRPPPLPAFSFNPGAAMEAEPSRSPSPTHPILEEMAQNRSRRSSRPANLTEFNICPRSSDLPPSPSPTKSNFGDANLGARNAGHRRRGSEFVGGGSDGSHLISPTMVSTSPGKSDHVRPPGPPISGSGPGRHRHRRSEAVSISGIDASELIKANAVAKHRAGSAPSTPSDPAQLPFFPPDNNPRVTEPVSGPSNRTVTSSPRLRRESAPGVRPRVGFSDTVDVIPRPLSMISSETEGSSSTIRGTHSLTGSINSFAAASPPAHSAPVFVASNENGSPRRRPSTADAATLVPSSLAQSNTSTGEDLLTRRPVSASASPSMSTSSASPTGKRKHFWFNHSNDSSPKTTPAVETADPISALPAFAPASPSTMVRPKTSPERSASIKKRKVRTWTGHLFSRKSRHPLTKAKGRRNPTPPLTRRVSDQMNEIFDADNTIVLRNSPPPDQQETIEKPAATCVVAPSPNPGYGYEPDERVTSPILDLDAALGPFGSEEKLANEENTPRGGSSRISRLHSSERRTATDAFGSFHRRAESAPQMAPVNRNAFGVHRLGSSTSIADDVFDEEEEDNFLAKEKVPIRATTITSETLSSDQPAEADNAQSPQLEQQPVQRKDPRVEEIVENNGLGIAMGRDVADRIAIVDTDEDLESRRPARSSNSTITAPVISEADLPKRPTSSPMEFLYGAPQTSYASSTEGRTTASSAISSPDAEHISFSSQPRLNRYAGDQNLDVVLRGSNDDLPSLTDSVSTGVMPRFSSSAGTRSSTEQRAVSFSGPTQAKSTQTWKRASLASLNRLIPGSANGSKLRFEETATPAEVEKAAKKSNRMSRLMHFWRSKEKGEK